MHTTSGEISPKTDTVWRCVSFDQPYDRPTSSSAVRNTAPRTKISALGVEEQRVNVIVHLLSPGAAPLLGQGFRVDARVVVSEVRDALRLPTDALVRNGTGWAVSRLEQGRARFTPVSIGDGGGDFHALRSGLTAGQRVILFPGSS